MSNTVQTNLNRRDNPRKKRSVKKIVLIGLGALVLLAGIAAISAKRIYESKLTKPLAESTEKVLFQIEEGENIDQIMSKLQEAEILPDNQVLYFKLYLRQSGLGNTIQAGQYRIPKNLNLKELAQTLQTAGIPDVWVTIPEGLRLEEYAHILDREFSLQEGAVFNSERFLSLIADPQYISTLEIGFTETPTTLEGLLFPDKYLFPLESSEELIIETMLNNFKNKAGNITYEQLIIASMLEREGKTGEQRRMITDIINRRLEEGWFLNIDATLLYFHQDWEHVLTEEDINTDHPYNTYTRLGLPPTPIANPGAVSLNAVLNPSPNNFYYYIHDDSGMIHYARTWEEHVNNINTYLR